MELGFIIKKIISAWLMPLPIGILLALLGIWFLFRDKIKHAKYLLVLSLLWVSLITYAPVADLLITSLEQHYSKLTKIPNNVEYILLLGGDKKRRAWEALRLYHQKPQLKIITSGYARYGDIEASEAYKTAQLLIQSGVKKENILRQAHAKDTQEEAIALKQTIGEHPFILVTSAYHMPRAMLLFEQEGLHPIPAPTDFHPPKKDNFLRMFQSKQLEKTEQAWHEFLGLLWLKLKR